MKEDKLTAVLSAYGFPSNISVTPHGSGLINHTWLVDTGKGAYILQRVNSQVFTRPQEIADNIEMVGRYLEANYPDITFPQPLRSLTGQTLHITADDQYYRLFPFIKDSVSLDLAHNPKQAYEAARQFGAFTRMLAGFPAQCLHETLPGFHNLPQRYHSFLQALQTAPGERLQKAGDLVIYLQSQNGIVTRYEDILKDPAFKRRVTHHDTKISNVLFDPRGKGICVIDLDTVMAGYFISDIGDMFRTYLSPVTEEEKDSTKISIRQEYFEAIVRGYLQEMQDVLTPVEKQSFVYAGEFMMYMQALRFLTDYLNNDVYYGSSYEGHNFFRARNQATLLRRFREQAGELEAIADALSLFTT